MQLENSRLFWGFLSTANTLKPRFLHALLNRQDPAKISKIKPEPLLGSSSVPKDSTEASGAKTHALTFGSLQKGVHALAMVPSEDRSGPGTTS